MAGVSVVRDRNTHWLRRSLWALIILFALVCFIWELVSGIQCLLDGDITKSWSHTSPTELQFPAVTVCPMNGVKSSVVLNATRANITQTDWERHGLALLRWDEMDLEQFLEAASYRWDEMVSHCTLAGQPCLRSGRLSHSFSRHLGQCYTLTPRSTVASTHLMPQLRLSLYESDPAALVGHHLGWLLILHPSSLSRPDTAALIGLAEIALVPPGPVSRLTIKRKRITRLCTDRSPCEQHVSMSDTVLCYDRCLSGGAGVEGGEYSATCRLPWIGDQPADTPPCTSYQQFLESTGHRRYFLNLSNTETRLLQELAACSSCSTSCSTERYTVSSTDRIQLYKDSENLITSDITILLESELEDVVEKYDYTFRTMLSDIGGMAGLMLGASLLTLVELIDSLIAAQCH